MKNQNTVKPTQETEMINKFMEKQYQSYPLLSHLNNVDYKNSWDNLMPVIEKISKLNIPDPDGVSENFNPYPRTFGMVNDDNGNFMFRFNRFHLHEAPILIDAAYEAVIYFLNNYYETGK